jgi:lysophospholipase L1-like esterase
MPIMGEGWRNSRMRLINRIFEKQAEQRPGAEYIDIWDLYANADGSFDPSLRLGDQVHFTVEGQQLLADTVYEAIEKDWQPAGADPPGASPPATPSASDSSL